MEFDIAAFLETLPIMAKGMAGIFIVTAEIKLSIIILNAVKRRAEKKDNKNIASARISERGARL